MLFVDTSTTGDSRMPHSLTSIEPVNSPAPLSTAVPAGIGRRHISAAVSGATTVQPVRATLPSGSSRHTVTCPTRTPGTSVIALWAPVGSGPNVSPRSRARGRGAGGAIAPVCSCRPVRPAVVCSRAVATTRPAFLRTLSLPARGRPDGYPFDVPAIASLDVIAFAPVTVFVGDNGSGKSTLIEAIALATGFNAEGGGRNLSFETHATHSELHGHLSLRFGRRPAVGWFLRAETFYGMATRIATDTGQFGNRQVLPRPPRTFARPVVPRPDAAALRRTRAVHHGRARVGPVVPRAAPAHGADGRRAGRRFAVRDRHAFTVAHAVPRARLLSFDHGAIREVAYDDLEVVALWRRFMEAPDVFLAALLGDEG